MTDVPRVVKTISPTSLSAWLRCGGDWYNRYVLRSPRDGTWNMMAGNCIHLGTQTLHQGGDWKSAMAEFYADHLEIMSASGAPSLETMYTLMRIYAQMNPRREGDRPEEYFKVQVEGIAQPLTGIFDLLPGGTTGIAEFKTGGWWTQSRADLAMQTIHYTLAYKTLFGVMPEFFHYYAFDFENVKVRRIKTGVHEDDLNDFVDFVKEVLYNMESGLLVTKCLFVDNKQVCWYPEECGKILTENRERAIKIEQREPSSESPKKRRKGKKVPGIAGDPDG